MSAFVPPELPPSPFDKPPPLPLTPPEEFRLSLLTPEAKVRVEAVCRAMMKRGWLCPWIGQTLRLPSEQEEAQRRGTTSKGQDLTWHFLRRAVDFRKRLSFNAYDQTTRDEAFFMDLYEEVTLTGMRSLAYKPDKTTGKLVKLLLNGKTWDAGHAEWREPFATLADATQAEAPELLRYA